MNFVGIEEKSHNEQPSVEQALYLALRRTGKFFMYSSVSSLLIGIIALITSIVIVVAGKDKDKLVFLNASGKPELVRVDNRDEIYGPELEMYIRELFPTVFNWDYAEAQTGASGHDEHMNRIYAKFVPEFFNEFMQPFGDIYISSIIKQRTVIKASVEAIKDVKIDPKDKTNVTALVNVKLRNLKVTDEEAGGESTQDKLYLVKIRKGVRGIENPYGLFTYFFTESSASSVAK